jgi:hypothetical protein
MMLEEIAQSLGTVGLRGALEDWGFIASIAAILVLIGFILWRFIATVERLRAPPRRKSK